MNRLLAIGLLLALAGCRYTVPELTETLKSSDPSSLRRFGS